MNQTEYVLDYIYGSALVYNYNLIWAQTNSHAKTKRSKFSPKVRKLLISPAEFQLKSLAQIPFIHTRTFI